MNPSNEAASSGRRHSMGVDGAFNVRDIGGATTTAGTTVLTERVYASATLDAITARGIEQLRAVDIGMVLDLRSPGELERHGRFPVDQYPVHWEHLSSTVAPPSGDEVRKIAAEQVTDPMNPMYVEIMRTSGPVFARGLQLLGDPGAPPAIVHCTSGKDRTGLFVLLLHLVVGVPLDAALAEYHQDDETTKRAASDMLGRYPVMGEMGSEVMMHMAGTHTEWVLSALESIGGERAVPAWLSSNGFDDHDQSRLRANLTG